MAQQYAGDGHKYYDHRLTRIKELTGEQEPPGQRAGPFAPRLRGDLKTAHGITVRELLQGVKMSDISSTLPLVDPNWGDDHARQVSDPFMDRMRVALDGDAKLRGVEAPVTRSGREPETSYYRNRNGEIILVKIEPMQIQKKFKHSIDFGIPESYNTDSSKALAKIISRHISDPHNQIIEGTYRGVPVVHIFDRRTGIDVIVDTNGKFVSGWKLNKSQLQNLLARGAL